MISALLYRKAMARVASGVAIVTTSDADGRWWGFTASSFTPLSLDPPLILVCLSRDAGCRPAFTSAPAFRVNVLGVEHEQLAVRFATRGADKFFGWRRSSVLARTDSRPFSARSSACNATRSSGLRPAIT